MREILFRGKRIGNGEWVEGSLLVWPDGDAEICHTKPDAVHEMLKAVVSPKTVGQYTGLTDKNGKKIFEGDIVLLRRKNLTPELFYVIWKNKSARFLLVDKNGVQPCPVDMADVEVVGNIHDNPEMLGGGEDGNAT